MGEFVISIGYSEDAPLQWVATFDTDSDRIAHLVFRSKCKHLRLQNKYKYVVVELSRVKDNAYKVIERECIKMKVE